VLPGQAERGVRPRPEADRGDPWCLAGPRWPLPAERLLLRWRRWGMWLDGFTGDHTTERLSERRVREAAQRGRTCLWSAVRMRCPDSPTLPSRPVTRDLRVCDIVELIDEAMRDGAAVTEPLRVIDFGCSRRCARRPCGTRIGYGCRRCSGHALFHPPGPPRTSASATTAGPTSVDHDYCRANGLPVLPAMVGGRPGLPGRGPAACPTASGPGRGSPARPCRRQGGRHCACCLNPP